MLIEEDVPDLMHRALRFAGWWVLEYIDPTRRITDVVPFVSLERGSLSWRTRTEHERSPNAVTMSMGPDMITAQLTPPRRHRAVLTQDLPSIMEDLVALLRREALAR